MELSLIGLQNAGKTSLVDTIATGAYHEDMIPTVGFNMRKVAKGSVTIKLWDLGGQVRHGCSTTAKYCLIVFTEHQRVYLALCQHLMYVPVSEVRVLTASRTAATAALPQHVGAVLPGSAGHCVRGGLLRCGQPRPGELHVACRDANWIVLVA